jgi:hypothetical protein
MAQNGLTNADFSEWLDDSTPAPTRPYDWVPESRRYAGIFEEFLTVHSAPCGCRIERRVDSTGNNNGVKQDSILVRPGARCSVGCWLRVDTLPGGTVHYVSARVLISWRDSAGASIRTSNPSYVTSDTWYRQVYEDSAPSNATTAIIMVRCYGRGNPKSISGGLVYADDAYFGGPVSVTEDGHSVTNIGLRLAPNPFSTRLRVHCASPLARPFRVRFYDATGQVVRELATRPDAAQDVTWDGCDETGNELPGGIYFAAVESSGVESAVQKVLLVR